MESIKEPITCEQKGCENEAFVEVFWPGQVVRMCAVCALKAQALGRAMGVEIPVRRLDGQS